MQIPADSRISTAVILNESGSNTRIAYLRQDGHIIGKGYNTENNVEEKKQFGNIAEAKAWVHEIAPTDAVFSKDSHSNDHFDNIGSNRRNFEEMWGIHHEPKDIVQLLNGSETYFDRCVGYCAYHKRDLTQTQLKSKDCLSKTCSRLIKIEHKFWQDRDDKQVEKKLKRALDIV